jgi:hypothetical protein
MAGLTELVFSLTVNRESAEELPCQSPVQRETLAEDEFQTQISLVGAV